METEGAGTGRPYEPLSTVSLTVGYGRMMLAPVLPLVLLLAGVVVRLSPGAVVLLLVLLRVGTGVAVIGMLSPGVAVRGGQLSVPRLGDRRREPGGAVDLTRLVSARSVSFQGGRVSGRGLALFRSQIWLEDADGGQAMFWAWGWSPKALLQSVLRDAVVASRARIDPMTWWRLGFSPGRGARISRVRRFI